MADITHPMHEPAPAYFERSKWTIHALWFLLLPVVAYELWAVTLAKQTGAPTLVAHSLIDKLFHQIGFSWAFLPGLVAVVSLLAVHVAENWKLGKSRLLVPPEPLLYGIMLLESLAWTVPLFVIGALLSMYEQTQGSMGLAQTAPALAAHPQVLMHQEPWSLWRQGMMLSLGAGIFEELVFRLFGLNLFDLITSALFGKQHPVGMAVGMAATAALFAAAHFLGDNNFTLPKAAFYFFGGVYFAFIFLWRGFGIAAATHVLFDMLVTTLLLRAQLA